MTFKSAIGTVVAVSAPETRGEALAGLFPFGYIGMALPVVLLGLVRQATTLVPPVLMFGAFMLALIAVTAVMLARCALPLGTPALPPVCGGARERGRDHRNSCNP